MSASGADPAYTPIWDPEAAGPVEVGIDVIEIERIRRAVERFGDRFLQRIYTPREREWYGRRVHELAARFAAKEATMKALGTGVRGVRWRDIEILPNQRGKPIVILHETALRRANLLGLSHWSVSLTHSRGDAIAIVVAAKRAL
jgi:holo-[acyl-carrier protein] synthase